MRRILYSGVLSVLLLTVFDEDLLRKALLPRFLLSTFD